MKTKPFQCWISNTRLNYRILMYQSPRGRLGLARNTVRDHMAEWGLKTIPRWGNDRTAYIVGLFGTGRSYISSLLFQNIGDRGAFFRDHWKLRIQIRPTSMIYTGHATIKYVSRAQTLPATTNRILEAVSSGYADWIFIYRHPLDSLLTNWIWWRTYLREGRMIGGISDVYKNSNDLIADLEQNFLEFKAFAEGDPNFFGRDPGLPFLSFPKFVEETELQIKSATLTIRLEDCTIDPLREVSKLLELISAGVDLNRLRVAPPITKPYRFLTIKEMAPQFRDYINGLNSETKRQINRIGYDIGF